MRLGLGTGTTVAQFLPALAKRNLDLRCVATSPRTAYRARKLGLKVEPFTLSRLDLAVDGADQISPDGWLVKGGGGAHTREKVVAVASERFVVIADSTKPVDRIHAPIPLELLAFGIESTLERLGGLFAGGVRLRDAPRSPDRGVIADLTCAIGDPARLATELEAVPGVVEHGLFSPQVVSTVLVGRGDSVETMQLRR